MAIIVNKSGIEGPPEEQGILPRLEAIGRGIKLGLMGLGSLPAETGSDIMEYGSGILEGAAGDLGLTSLADSARQSKEYFQKDKPFLGWEHMQELTGIRPQGGLFETASQFVDPMWGAAAIPGMIRAFGKGKLVAEALRRASGIDDMVRFSPEWWKANENLWRETAERTGTPWALGPDGQLINEVSDKDVVVNLPFVRKLETDRAVAQIGATNDALALHQIMQESGLPLDKAVEMFKVKYGRVPNREVGGMIGQSPAELVQQKQMIAGRLKGLREGELEVPLQVGVTHPTLNAENPELFKDNPLIQTTTPPSGANAYFDGLRTIQVNKTDAFQGLPEGAGYQAVIRAEDQPKIISPSLREGSTVIQPSKATPQTDYVPPNGFQGAAQMWKSDLQDMIDQAPKQPMDGVGWTQWIKSNAGKYGVKADEIYWSGVEDWLAMQPGKVDPKDIQGYIGEQFGIQKTPAQQPPPDRSGFITGIKQALKKHDADIKAFWDKQDDNAGDFDPTIEENKIYEEYDRTITHLSEKYGFDPKEVHEAIGEHDVKFRNVEKRLNEISSKFQTPNKDRAFIEFKDSLAKAVDEYGSDMAEVLYENGDPVPLENRLRTQAREIAAKHGMDEDAVVDLIMMNREKDPAQVKRLLTNKFKNVGQVAPFKDELMEVAKWYDEAYFNSDTADSAAESRLTRRMENKIRAIAKKYGMDPEPALEAIMNTEGSSDVIRKRLDEAFKDPSAQPVPKPAPESPIQEIWHAENPTRIAEYNKKYKSEVAHLEGEAYDRAKDALDKEFKDELDADSLWYKDDPTSRTKYNTPGKKDSQFELVMVNKKDNYQHGHWPYKGVIGHVRGNIRVSNTGWKQMVIDEVQSDKAAMIRDSGPYDQEKIDALQQQVDAVNETIKKLLNDDKYIVSEHGFLMERVGPDLAPGVPDTVTVRDSAVPPAVQPLLVRLAEVTGKLNAAKRAIKRPAEREMDIALAQMNLDNTVREWDAKKPEHGLHDPGWNEYERNRSQALSKAISDLENAKGTNTFSPFVADRKGKSDPKIYTRLLMKRIFRKAADEGVNEIVWTPGAVQSERWEGTGAHGHYEYYGNEWGNVPESDYKPAILTQVVKELLDKSGGGKIGVRHVQGTTLKYPGVVLSSENVTGFKKPQSMFKAQEEDPASLTKSVLHELSHYVNKKHGLPGGAPTFASHEEWNARRENVKRSATIYHAAGNLKENPNFSLAHLTPAEAQEARRISKRDSMYKIIKVVKNHTEYMKYLERYAKDAKGAYRSIMGEEMARNVEASAHMSQEEINATPWWKRPGAVPWEDLKELPPLYE